MAACGLRIRRYQQWLRIKPRRDDLFAFRGAHRLVALAAGTHGFELPDGLDLRGRTVLLRIAVKVSPLGHLLDPYIDIRCMQRSYRQYFERGALGQRYLNLSSLFTDDNPSVGRHVQLSGSSIGWQDGASLLVFEAPITAHANILVLAPHPDDAEIAAFGLYAYASSWVATVTAGEKATGNLPEAINPNARSSWAAFLRVTDSLSVPQLGYVPPDRRINLVCPDGQLEAMFREPNRPFRLACDESLSRAQLRCANQRPEFKNADADCTWTKLVGELQSLLELTQPDIIVCPHPLLDTHADHIFTTVALERAMRECSGTRPLLFLYTVHSHGGPLFPFGPVDSLVATPPAPSVKWLADSIYSRQLDESIRQAKYFAVEAMHATRIYPATERSSARSLLQVMRREILAYLVGLPVHPANLLRRAPRPNEIYYVLQGESLAELLEQAPEPLLSRITRPETAARDLAGIP